MNISTFTYSLLFFFSFSSIIFPYLSSNNINNPLATFGRFLIFICIVVIGMTFLNTNLMLGTLLFLLYLGYRIRLGSFLEANINKQNSHTTKGTFDFLKRKWRHPDPRIRRVGVAQLRDQSILEDIANTDEDPDIRIIAIGKISNSDVLAGIARISRHSNVRMAAMKRVKDPTVIEDIVKYSKYEDIRIAAMKRVKDATVIEDVARYDEHADVRIAAMKRVKDPTVIEDIARSGWHNDVRIVAIKKVEDQIILADIAKNEWHNGVGMAAVERVEDPTLLIQIAKSSSYSHVNNRALSKLKKLYKSILSNYSQDDITERIKIELSNMDNETKRKLFEEVGSENAFIQVIFKNVATHLINKGISYFTSTTTAASKTDQITNLSMEQQEIMSPYLEQILSYEAVKFVNVVDSTNFDTEIAIEGSSFIEMIVNFLNEESSE